MPNTAQCPICRRAVAGKAENPAYPFCTERCRTIDLGRWLDGAYRFAVESADEDEDGNIAPLEKRSDEES